MDDGSDERTTLMLPSYEAILSNFVFVFSLRTFENLKKSDVACIIVEVQMSTPTLVFIRLR